MSERGADLTGALPRQPVTWIRPSRKWVLPDFGELWRHRELLYFLVWRDVTVRYKQTVLGATWAVLQPFAMMLVFSVFFGRLARIPSGGVPYPVFAYAALVPWTFFANGVTLATGSLVYNQSLITKVYFPRLLIPVAAVLSGLIDLLLAFVILIGLLLFYDIAPGLRALWALPLMLLAATACVGVGLWLSALNVQYRDITQAMPFVTQVWLFATPIVYSSTLLPERWRTLYGLNPMVGVVEGFRSALLGTKTLTPGMLAASAGSAIVLFVCGVLFFRRREWAFADVV
jgi:lipopolysaccharide transport system permease protein